MENNETGIWALWKGQWNGAVIISVLTLTSVLSSFSFQQEGQVVSCSIQSFLLCYHWGVVEWKLKEKAAAAAKAFRFMDTSPQKQVRATSVTWALKQVTVFCSNTQSLQKCIYCCFRYSFQMPEAYVLTSYILEVKSTGFPIVKIFEFREEALIKSTSNLPGF